MIIKINNKPVKKVEPKPEVKVLPKEEPKKKSKKEKIKLEDELLLEEVFVEDFGGEI